MVEENETNPEVESVPRLFLGVDAVDLGPADGPDIGLMALFEVDKLQTREQQQCLKCQHFCLATHYGMSYLVTHLWNKRRTSRDGLHNPRWRQPLLCIKSTKR